MLALPPAAPPAPKRQVFVATALLSAAGIMMLGGMSALWFRFRTVAGATSWKPDDLVVPEVATNVMWITVIFAAIMVQWAVYAVKHRDRTHAALAIGFVGLLGIAILNSQAYTWARINLPVKGETAYNPMFYAFTGTVFALVLIGVVYAGIAAFRVLGGRIKDQELVSGLALYWYFLTAAVTVVWFVVYVTK